MGFPRLGSSGLLFLMASVSFAAGAEQRAPRPDRPELFRPRNLPTSPVERTRVQHDRWGRVVLDEKGKRITYPGPGGPTDQAQAPRPARRAAQSIDASLPLASQWHRSTFGWGIGFKGMATFDFDGDGREEIVASAIGYNDFWYVLTLHDGEYVHAWTSNPYPDGIDSLRVVNADAGPVPEIVIGSGSRIYIHDGLTRALEATVTTTATEIRGLTIADVDSDGALELVFCDPYTLFVYGVASGALEFAGPGLGGRDLAVGNVDNDAALEIVVGDGSDPGRVLNGQTHAVEWVNNWGFGDYVRLGDVDGDGRQEAIAGYYWSDIKIFDVELQSLTASIPLSHDLGALRVLDVEGDGPLEIVYGDGQWGHIHVLNGQTLLEKWAFPNPDPGVTEIAVGDADGDGTRELLYGAGYSSSGPDHFVVVDTVTHQQEWQSLDIGGPFLALSYGDVDADGRVEILSGSFESDSGYEDGLWFVHDALTRELEYQSGPTTGQNWTGLRRIRNANVDGDAQQEVFVASSYLYDGVIICYDGLTHAEQWQFQIPSGMIFGSLAVADVDNDGQLEVIAGVNVEHTGATGVFVYVINAATGLQEWQSPSLASNFADLSLMRVAEVDGDGRLEIVVGAYFGAVYVIDGVTHTIQNLGDHDVTAVETADRDGNGVSEIIVGTDGGALKVLDPFSGTVLQTIGPYPGRIDGLAVIDVTGDTVADYAFAVNDEVSIIDGVTGGLAWSSGVIGDEVGAQDSLLIADVDGDGVLELMVNIGYTGFRVYEGGPLRLFAGDATAQETPGGSAAVFTVALSTVPTAPVTVQYGTANGTATAGVDYLPTAGALTFPAGTTTRTVSVAILDDTAYEGNETFFLNLSNPTGASIQDGQGAGTIVENEPAISISVDDVTVVEGSSGTTTATFVVTLSAPSSLTTTVSYATADGTAIAPGDYQPASGTVTFAPGVVSQPVIVSVVGDTAVEVDETFQVNLSGPVNAAIADGQAVGAILDDDAPSLSRIELSHGSAVVTDLAAQPGPAADEDYYRIGQKARSSYEVVVDAASGDVVPLALDRLAADNVTVVQGATVVGTGTSVSLRWMNPFSAPILSQHLRVRSGGCTTSCGPDDQYRIRVYETTYRVPRFNNSGSQLSVLLVQNPTSYSVSGQVYFWHSDGTLLHAEPFNLPAKGLFSLNASTIPALAGQSGSVTVANDARYGDLTGKAVSLEPSTGFSFDSIMALLPK
jgi:hypothetical protein